jgi:hypothetical protein
MTRSCMRKMESCGIPRFWDYETTSARTTYTERIA